MTSPNGSQGALVIVGGGGTPPMVHDEFFRLAGDERARVIHIPSATQTFEEIPDKREYYCEFYGRNIASFEFLHTYDRAVAEQPGFAAPLEHATGVWIGGGTQSRLAALFLGTEVVAGIQRMLDRGGVVGGTSSGCAIMSEAMIEYGYEFVRLGQGFALYPKAICDAHFTERERHKRGANAVLLYPDHICVGIDEKTALVVQGNQLRVLGPMPETAVWFHFAETETGNVRRYRVATGHTVELSSPARGASLTVVEAGLAAKFTPDLLLAADLVPIDDEDD